MLKCHVLVLVVHPLKMLVHHVMNYFLCPLISITKFRLLEIRSRRLLSGVADSRSAIPRVSQTCKLIDLRSMTLLIKVAGSLDLQLTPSHTWTRSPTLGLVLPN